MHNVLLIAKTVVKKVIGPKGCIVLLKQIDYAKKNVAQLLGPAHVRSIISFLDRFYVNSPFGTKLQKEIRSDFKIGMAVLVHERPELLALCLDSLFKTNLYNYDITFLIQDDGSTDEKVRKVIEQGRDSKYKIIRSYTKKGHNSWGAAFNKAMRTLMGIDNFDIMGSCDGDAFFHPEWLDQTMKICLWAKKNHKDRILGPFSSFNSSDFIFHRILGTYDSPYGRYVVKERMGALNYFYFREDFIKLGFFEEHKDDETLMTDKFKQMRVRNFCTETSYVEHLGRLSVLDKWRPKEVGSNAAYALKPVRQGWTIPASYPEGLPLVRLSNNLVLEIKYGGLGDHLFYSHLPRIAKESGLYNKVYISNFSELRNEEIRKLIWDLNPYVDGFCNDSGTFASFEVIQKGCNLMDEIMFYHNLDDGRRFHEPEVYYRPKLKEELRDKIIYDPNYISNAGELNSDHVRKYFREKGISIDLQMKTREKYIPITDFAGWLESESLEDFCDMIYSCKQIYCLVTGTATLAPALDKSATVLYAEGVGKMFLHSHMNQYVMLK